MVITIRQPMTYVTILTPLTPFHPVCPAALKTFLLSFRQIFETACLDS